MNPQFHEEFVQLCALFYSDEISDEDWALLQVHMAYCKDCESRFFQYQQLARDVIPMMAAAAVAAEADAASQESPEALRQAEQRLMESLKGVPQIQAPRSGRHLSIRSWGIAFAGCLLVCIVFAGIYIFHPREQTKGPASAAQVHPDTDLHAANPSNDPLKTVTSTSDQPELQELRRQLSAKDLKLQQSGSMIESLLSKIRSEQEEREQIVGARDALSAQLVSAQSETQTLRDKLASSQTDSGQMVAHVAQLESKVRMLNVSLEDANNEINTRERMLALDKDFLTHDREIRDVIGARDLKIVDIEDLTETGKPAKAFGRIFYTSDRSLVFYGFDLEKQPGLKQAAAFQVWGSGSDQKPISLGLFYQDDSHKRWVMRFDDPKMLSRLNMVFVTVEPPGGSHKPTGKQFLRAYLQTPVNHP